MEKLPISKCTNKAKKKPPRKGKNDAASQMSKIEKKRRRDREAQSRKRQATKDQIDNQYEKIAYLEKVRTKLPQCLMIYVLHSRCDLVFIRSTTKPCGRRTQPLRIPT